MKKRKVIRYELYEDDKILIEAIVEWEIRGEQILHRKIRIETSKPTTNIDRFLEGANIHADDYEKRYLTERWD